MTANAVWSLPESKRVNWNSMPNLNQFFRVAIVSPWLNIFKHIAYSVFCFLLLKDSSLGDISFARLPAGNIGWNNISLVVGKQLSLSDSSLYGSKEWRFCCMYYGDQRVCFGHVFLQADTTRVYIAETFPLIYHNSLGPACGRSTCVSPIASLLVERWPVLGVLVLGLPPHQVLYRAPIIVIK